MKYACLAGAVLVVGLFLTLMLTSRTKPLETRRFDAGETFTDNKNIIGDSTLDQRLKEAGYTMMGLSYNPTTFHSRPARLTDLADQFQPDDMTPSDSIPVCHRGSHFTYTDPADGGVKECNDGVVSELDVGAVSVGTPLTPRALHLPPGSCIEDTLRERKLCWDGTQFLLDAEVPYDVTPSDTTPVCRWDNNFTYTDPQDGRRKHCRLGVVRDLTDADVPQEGITPTDEERHRMYGTKLVFDQQERLLEEICDEQRRLTALIRQLLEAQQPQRQEEAP